MKNKDSKPAGSTAPVFGSQKSVSPSGKEEFTYEEVHNAKDLQDLLSE